MSAGTGRRARYLLGGVALIAMSGVGLGSLVSSALLTSTSSTTAATVASGTVTITQSGAFSTDLAATAMMPGDAQYTVLTVNNTGQPTRVSAAGTWNSAANTLTQNLTFQAVTVAASSTTCAAANFVLTPTFVSASSNVATVYTSAAPNFIVGTQVTIANVTNVSSVYSGTFTVTAVDNVLNTFSYALTTENLAKTAVTGTTPTVTVKTSTTSTTALTIFGDSSTGQQTGDQAYTASSTQYYCFKLALPSTVTDNTGQTNTLTVTVNAEQTKNN